MSDIPIRNLEPQTVRQLKERAKRNNRSLQAEVREILEQEAGREGAWREFNRIADEIRSHTRGIPQTDSAELIREDRDR